MGLCQQWSFACIQHDGGCLVKKGLYADHLRCEWRGCCECACSAAATQVSCCAWLEWLESLWLLTYLNRAVDLWLAAEASSCSNDTLLLEHMLSFQATQPPSTTSCWAAGQELQVLWVPQNWSHCDWFRPFRPRRQPPFRPMKVNHRGCCWATCQHDWHDAGQQGPSAPSFARMVRPSALGTHHMTRHSSIPEWPMGWKGWGCEVLRLRHGALFWGGLIPPLWGCCCCGGVKTSSAHVLWKTRFHWKKQAITIKFPVDFAINLAFCWGTFPKNHGKSLLVATVFFSCWGFSWPFCCSQDFAN